jgi:hypothetical protein
MALQGATPKRADLAHQTAALKLHDGTAERESAVERGWLEYHTSGTHDRFLQKGSELFD